MSLVMQRSCIHTDIHIDGAYNDYQEKCSVLGNIIYNKYNIIIKINKPWLCVMIKK